MNITGFKYIDDEIWTAVHINYMKDIKKEINKLHENYNLNEMKKYLNLSTSSFPYYIYLTNLSTIDDLNVTDYRLKSLIIFYEKKKWHDINDIYNRMKLNNEFFTILSRLVSKKQHVAYNYLSMEYNTIIDNKKVDYSLNDIHKKFLNIALYKKKNLYFINHLIYGDNLKDFRLYYNQKKLNKIFYIATNGLQLNFNTFIL